MTRRAIVVGLLSAVFYAGLVAGVAIRVEWDWYRIGRALNRRRTGQ